MISIEQLFIKKEKVKKLLFRGQKDRLVKSFQRTSENQVSPCSLLLNLFRSFLIYFHISNDKLFILDTSGDVIKYTCINKKSFWNVWAAQRKYLTYLALCNFILIGWRVKDSLMDTSPIIGLKPCQFSSITTSVCDYWCRNASIVIQQI